MILQRVEGERRSIGEKSSIARGDTHITSTPLWGGPLFSDDVAVFIERAPVKFELRVRAGMLDISRRSYCF